MHPKYALFPLLYAYLFIRSSGEYGGGALLSEGSSNKYLIITLKNKNNVKTAYMVENLRLPGCFNKL